MKKWCSKCVFPNKNDLPFNDYCEFVLMNKKLIIYLNIICQLKNGRCKMEHLDDVRKNIIEDIENG